MIATPLFYASPKLLGHLADNAPIHGYSIRNSKGMTLNVANFGATVTHLFVPVGNAYTDVVLGFDNFNDYMKSYKFDGSPYFGALVGRVAGRIEHGNYTYNNQDVQLTVNHGKHQLHGGFNGFSQKIWQVKQALKNKITFSYMSKDGEEGYPANLFIDVTYEITEDNTWLIKMEAFADADTLVNLTQHSYFNLNDEEEDLSNHLLQLQATAFLETKDDLIPTGKLVNAEQTPFNFSTFKKAPTAIDNTFVNNSTATAAACLQCSTNKLQMKVYTNQPATHIYVGGKCTKNLLGKKQVVYNTYSGICFETQNFPDAIHHPNFPSIVLKKGETYTSETSFAFEETV